MPVAANGVGFSDNTPNKQRLFGHIVDQHLAVVSKIREKFLQNHYSGWPGTEYLYIDATSGSGHSPETGDAGSPLIVAEQARRSGMPYRCHLIDRNAVNAETLRTTFAEDPRCEVYCGEYQDVLSSIVSRIRGRPYGLIYFDPNGQPDFDFIARLSQHPALSRVDVLIHFTATGLKRARRIAEEDTLEARLHRVNKQHWMIAQVTAGSPWQWTFLLGLNYRMKPYEKMGFAYIDSDRGERLLYEMNYTKDEKCAIPARRQLILSDFVGRGVA